MADPHPSPEARLAALLEAVKEPLRMLDDARAQPPDQRQASEKNALHFLLTALRAAGDEAVAQQIDRYLTESAHAATYLLDLANGWRCAACQQRVPGGAALSAVQSGAPKLAIVCKACGAASPATVDGTKALFRRFAVSAAWDPRPSGFRWDGT